MQLTQRSIYLSVFATEWSGCNEEKETIDDGQLELHHARDGAETASTT